MKRFLSGVLTVLLLCGMLLGCGSSQTNTSAKMKQSTDVSDLTEQSSQLPTAEKIASGISESADKSISKSEFAAIQKDGKQHYMSTISYALADETKTEVGTIDLVDSEGFFDGAVITSTASAYMAQDYAKSILGLLGVSKSNIDKIQNNMFQQIKSGQTIIYDTEGFRVLSSQKDEFVFYVRPAVEISNYTEGNMQTSNS